MKMGEKGWGLGVCVWGGGGEGGEGGDTLTSRLVRKSETNTYPQPHLLVDSLLGQRHQLLESKD